MSQGCGAVEGTTRGLSAWAGSSYLDNAGYPLAFELWELIKDTIPNAQERTDIQVKIDNGATGIEHALDLLDDGGANDTPYRHLVTTAIADLFRLKNPDLDVHVKFIERLSHRADLSVKVFSLNYDPLVERAAEFAKVRVSDGFLGVEHAYFARGGVRGAYRSDSVHPQMAQVL